MSARKNDGQINLLPQRGFEATVPGRILAWVLSTFRVIVIVTEIIVMIAFLSRFWFDAQNSDLNEKIEQTSDVVMAASEFEKEFKDVQKRIEIYKSSTAYASQNSGHLANLSQALPQDVILTKYSRINNEVAITARTTSERSIHQFVANLEKQGTYQDVALSRITTEPENPSILVLTITAVTKGV